MWYFDVWMAKVFKDENLRLNGTFSREFTLFRGSEIGTAKMRSCTVFLSSNWAVFQKFKLVFGSHWSLCSQVHSISLLGEMWMYAYQTLSPINKCNEEPLQSASKAFEIPTVILFCIQLSIHECLPLTFSVSSRRPKYLSTPTVRRALTTYAKYPMPRRLCR